MASPFSNSEPSLCIPRVFPNITRQRIEDVFDSLDLGTIERIDMVNKTSRDGKKYKQVFIHFTEWSKGEEAYEFRCDMMKGVKREVDYEPIKNSTSDEWWYWRVEKSHVPKPDRSEKTTTATKTKVQPRIRNAKVHPTKTHPGKAHPTSGAGGVSDEITTLKRQVFTLETQLGLLQAQMERVLEMTLAPPPLVRTGRVYPASTTPEYTPSSPVYMPETPEPDYDVTSTVGPHEED